MSRRTPPAFAMWLLQRLGASYQAESLAGDLIEQYSQGCSRYWCWKQVIVAIALARVRAITDAFDGMTRMLSRYVRRPGRRRRILNRLIGAFIATALGAGAATWAGSTSPKTACTTTICTCEKTHAQAAP